MIDILLATYNGEKYVGPQIDSLLQQSFTEWKLLIRDDGSTDGTRRICAEFATRRPERIRLLADGDHWGVLGNFNRLLRESAADYVMFCDQDDVWLPEKVEHTLAAMRELEMECGAHTPILVYSDSRVVDEDLGTIAPSSSRWTHRATHSSLGRICMELPLFGHQMMINRALTKLAGPIPEEFVSWDWWFPMVATVLGRIRFVDEPLVLWRRHATAASDTMKHRLSSYASRTLADYHRKVNISLRQSEIFHERFREKLNAEQTAFFAGVCRIREANWLMRRALIIRYRLFKTGFLKTAGVLLAA